MERYLSIKYPKMRFTLRRNSIQFVYLSAVTVYNLIFYMPVIFLYDIQEVNSSEYHYVICTNQTFIIYYMDMINRVIISFILMFISSILLINSMFMTRRRVILKYTTKENEKLKKDITFAISSISLNFIYLVLNLPYSITTLMNTVNIWTEHIFNLNFALSFYILFTNSLFRREFVLMLKSIKWNKLKFEINLSILK